VADEIFNPRRLNFAVIGPYNLEKLDLLKLVKFLKMAKMEQTVVLIKPDALQRGLTGEIIQRFDRKGLKLVGIKWSN